MRDERDKLCINCRYALQRGRWRPEFYCKHPEMDLPVKKCMVTGRELRPEPMTCKNARGVGYHTCGYLARYYEERDDV